MILQYPAKKKSKLMFLKAWSLCAVNLLEMQILEFHLDLNQNFRGWSTRLGFDELYRLFWCSLKFEK